MLCMFMQPANLTCYISTWKHNQVLQILRVMRCWARFFFLFLKGGWCWDRWMAIPPLQQHKKNGTKCCISWPEWKHDKVSCRVAHPAQSPLLAVLHHALYFTYRQNSDHTSRQKTKTTPIIHDTSDHATIMNPLLDLKWNKSECKPTIYTTYKSREGLPQYDYEPSQRP